MARPVASDRGNYPLLGAGNRVLIVNGRVGTSTSEGAKYVIDSADGGVSFDGGSQTAVDFEDIYGGAAFIDNAVLTVGGYTNTGGALFQASLADPPPVVAGKFSISNGATTSGSSLASQGESVVVSYTESGSAYSRQLIDDDNINSSAAWSAPQLITTVGSSRAELLSGASGFYFAYVTPDGQDIAIRALSGGTWGAPVVITPPGGGVSGRFAVTEDPSGIVHVAYTESDGDLMYRYARSTANTEFTNPQTLVPYPNDASSFLDLELAVNASGNGYVSYYDTDRARVMPVAPGEPATAARRRRRVLRTDHGDHDAGRRRQRPRADRAEGLRRIGRRRSRSRSRSRPRRASRSRRSRRRSSRPPASSSPRSRRSPSRQRSRPPA